jgi:hypothetical protein
VSEQGLQPLDAKILRFVRRGHFKVIRCNGSANQGIDGNDEKGKGQSLTSPEVSLNEVEKR